VAQFLPQRCHCWRSETKVELRIDPTNDPLFSQDISSDVGLLGGLRATKALLGL
jgi:hypothetical protein